MSLKVFSLAHRSEVTVSALIDPAVVKYGEVNPVTLDYKVGSGAPAAYRGHNGIDLVGKDGAEIYSITDGVVRVNAYEANGAGNYVSIGKVIDGVTHCFLYMHMKERSELQEGQTVIAGQFIGRQGSTGKSTGSHLHFGVKIAETMEYADPYYWAVQKGTGYNMTYETGIYKIIVDGLRVRKKPTLDGEKLGTVKNGETVEVTSIHMDNNNGAWGKIGEDRWICTETIEGNKYTERVGDLPDQSETIERLERDISALKDTMTSARAKIDEVSEMLEV